MQIIEAAERALNIFNALTDDEILVKEPLQDLVAYTKELEQEIENLKHDNTKLVEALSKYVSEETPENKGSRKTKEVSIVPDCFDRAEYRGVVFDNCRFINDCRKAKLICCDNPVNDVSKEKD